MGGGLIVSALLTKDVSKIILYGKVRRSHRERVLKQSGAVAPAMNLRVGKSSKNQRRHGDHCDTERPCDPSCLRDIRYSEHDRNKQTNGRNIKVTVRHRLPTNLNESDNGDQRSHEPKPAYDEVRPNFQLGNTERRNSNQYQRS